MVDFDGNDSTFNPMMTDLVNCTIKSRCIVKRFIFDLSMKVLYSTSQVRLNELFGEDGQGAGNTTCGEEAHYTVVITTSHRFIVIGPKGRHQSDATRGKGGGTRCY